MVDSKQCEKAAEVVAWKKNKSIVKVHNVLSLFSGCGGMDLGFEGDFSVLERSINRSMHEDWIVKEEKKAG